MVGGLDLASCQLLNTGTEVIALYILCMLPEVQRVGWWNLFPLLLPPLFLPPPSHAPSLLAPPKAAPAHVALGASWEIAPPPGAQPQDAIKPSSGTLP